jgi:hypothetical protein
MMYKQFAKISDGVPFILKARGASKGGFLGLSEGHVTNELV